MAPQCTTWQRTRQSHHGGAVRSYLRPVSPRYGRSSPLYCQHCAQLQSTTTPLSLQMEQSPMINCLLPKKDLLDDIDGSLLDKGVCMGVGW